METKLNTDVLIVGAGPTGLMAANQLARFGIDFIILDKKSGPTRESRAIAVTARSLEIYEQMGLIDKVLSQGKRITSFNLYDAGKRRAEVPIGEIGKGLSEYSYMLAFEQSKNEELLWQNLQSMGKQVQWNYEFVQLHEFQSGIKAEVKAGDVHSMINAKYLIACDGASSPARIQLNFSFHGGTYDHKFFVADTVMNWDQGYNKLVIAPGKENFCGFLPMYGERNYRVIGSLPKRYFDQDEITFHDIEHVVKRNLGIAVEFESVNWFSTYKLHHRAVDHFREGNVFLAGDSAHIHSPAGGQGMNTGLQDAYNIAWKLALVIKGQANKSLLNTYNEERLPFARWLISFTDRGFNTMTSSNIFIRFFRQNVALLMAKFVLSNTSVRRFAFRTISQTGWSYKGRSLSKSLTRQSLKFKAGDRLPYLGEDNIYQNLKNPCFHLLHIDKETMTATDADTLKKLFPFEVTIVEDALHDSWKRLGVKSGLYVLVRPDNYIGLLADSVESISKSKYLDQYFRIDTTG